jgi:excinuclease ABC subunit A
VKRHQVKDVVDFVTGLAEGTKLAVVSAFHLPEGRSCQEQLTVLQMQGFSRIEKTGNLCESMRFWPTPKTNCVVIFGW